MGRYDSSLAPKLDVDSTQEVSLGVVTPREAPTGTFRVAAKVITSAEIRPYLPLVHEEVGRILRRLPPNVLRDDLVAAGTCGLMDALRKNPGDRGPQFEWYARIRIRGAVLDELRSEDWLSRSARAEVSERAKEEQRSGTVIVGLEDLPEHRRLTIPSEDESPLDLAERQSQRNALARAVAELPPREAQIVEMHYFQGIQFKDIATTMKVSEPRISQLHSRAVTMLRGILESQQGAGAI